MVASERKLDEEKGDHKVTFTLTVALAFPTGKLMYCFKKHVGFPSRSWHSIKLHRYYKGEVLQTVIIFLKSTQCLHILMRKNVRFNIDLIGEIGRGGISQPKRKLGEIVM